MHKLKYNPDRLLDLCDDGLMSLGELSEATEREAGGIAGIPNIKVFGKFTFEKTNMCGSGIALRTLQEGTDRKEHYFYVTENRNAGLSVYVTRNQDIQGKKKVGDLQNVQGDEVWAEGGNLTESFTQEVLEDQAVAVLDKSRTHLFTRKKDHILQETQFKPDKGPVLKKKFKYGLDGKQTS